MNFGYKIEHTSYTVVTRDSDPEDRWDADDLDTTWNIGSKITETDDKYPDIVVPFKLEAGQQYYLVYVIHNTGDSFHYHEGYGCEFIEIFKDEAKANNLVEQIQQQNKDYHNNRKDLGKNAYQLSYKDENGHAKDLHCNWNGYFESINTCAVQGMTFQPKKKSKVKYQL